MANLPDRDKLIDLLRQTTTALPTLSDDKLATRCQAVDTALLDYSLDPELKRRFFEAWRENDFDRAVDVMDAALDLIFDMEIRDCYSDFISAGFQRFLGYVVN